MSSLNMDLGVLEHQMHQAHRNAVQAELSAAGLQEVGHPLLLCILRSAGERCPDGQAQRELAAHMHKNFPVGHPGYMGRLVYAQDVYAVTAACLMVRKDVYEQVNGLDESFAVAFNDVDFCVRVREAGYTNVFTPFAQLYHYESKSRGLDESPAKRKRFASEVERFQKRWAKQLAAGDPCMNPNFDLMKEDFSFDIKPLE